MNNLKKILEEYDIKLNSFKALGKVTILDTNKGKLVFKENSKLELVEYIEEKEVPDEQRLNDLIHLSGILHRQTSFNKEIDMDEIKKIYEDIVKKNNYLRSYYEDLNTYIDTKVFMSPSEYLLVSNIDLIYYLLDFVHIEIDNWYKEVKEHKTIRYSMIHNNLDLSHILESDNKYLISWSKSRLDMPIIDMLKLYQDNYYDLNLEDFLREYERENRINNNEYLFFLINLAMLKKIEFSKNTYQDCYNINNYLVYLRKIVIMVQKYSESLKKV